MPGKQGRTYKKQKKEKSNNQKVMRKKEKVKYQTITSTQNGIPVKNFVNGIIVTDDGGYVKIVEVIPSPFFMKPEDERDRIFESFYEMLRTAPVTMQVKCISMPADISKQLKALEENRKLETNGKCKLFYNDYRQRLLYSQETGVSKRFFIIFRYEKPRVGAFAGRDNKPEIEKATEALNNAAYRIASKMSECYNHVVLDSDPVKQNFNNMEILYSYLNRDRIKKIPFDDRCERIINKYAEYYGSLEGYNIPSTEFIAPEIIDFTDMNFVKVNDTYYKYFCIPSNGYNQYVYPGWLNMFVQEDLGVDIDVYYNKIEDDIQSKLKRTLGHAKADVYAENDNTDAFEAAQTTYKAAYYLRNGLLNGQDAYYMTTIVSVSDTDLNNLYSKIERIMISCQEQDIKLLEMKMQNEQAFYSTLPLCQLDRTIFNKTKQNMLTEAAAAFYMFTSFELNHPGGIYVGDDRQTGSLVVIDYFNREVFPNANVFIAGTSGAGKTYSLMLMAIRTRLSRIPIIVLAPEKENEFRRLCNELGGSFIQVSKSASTRINPMEIFMKDQEAIKEQELIDGVSDSISYLTEKVNTLLQFCQMLADDKLQFEERSILENCIINTYKKYGITFDNDSLWNEDHTGFKEMPIFSDLKETIEEDEHATVKLKQLALMLTSGSASTFNGHTNVDTSNDFTVFGLEHNDDKFLPIAIFLAMDFAWSKIKESRTKKKMLIIDEWWKMAFNPIAADYSMEIAKVIRAYSGSVCFATQNMSDVLQAGNAGNAVLSNCSIIFLMKMRRADLQAINDTGAVTLSDDEMNMIERFETGNALLIAANNRIRLKFIASKNEHALISTDNESLRRYKNAKQQELDEKAFKEYVDAAPDIDNIFADDNEMDSENTFTAYSVDDDDVIEFDEN